MSRFIKAGVVLSVFLAGCQSGSDITGDLGGLAVEATAVVAAPPAQNVLITAKITNISSNTIQVNYGSCSVTPILHSGSLTGPVVYDPRPTESCPPAATTKSLDPDQSLQLTANVVPNLPAGKYYVDVIVAVNGTEIAVGGGTVTF